MTITDLLADLEAKAEQARAWNDEHGFRPTTMTCSPERILALVVWVNQARTLLAESNVELPWNNETEERLHKKMLALLFSDVRGL